VNPFAGLAAVRTELGATLVDVVSAVLVQEAAPTEEPLGPGTAAVARLGIHDTVTHVRVGVEVRLGLGLARVLAGEMMALASPQDEDVVDAVAELGNIAAGATKALLCQDARLSLPSAALTDEPFEISEPGVQQVRAVVLGHVVQLSVAPTEFDGLLWPPAVPNEALGGLR
jgi:hypothetical protein